MVYTVRERAEALGITSASELARRSGLSFTAAIRIWRTGKVGNLAAAQKLARTLGVSLDELVGDGGKQ
jgi:transcriptional regulator with XRE-family HTH domain